MKYPTLTALSAAFIVLAPGCDRQPSVSDRMEQVQVQAKEAGRDIQDFTFAQKAEFTESMRKNLAAMNAELDQIGARIEKSGDAAKAEAQPKLQALREQMKSLDRQLDDARNATESTWDQVKDGTKKAYAEVEAAFNQARQWVSDKIAP